MCKGPGRGRSTVPPRTDKGSMWLEKSKGKNGMWVTKAMVDIGPDYAGPVGPVKILGLSLKVMRSH